MTRIEPSAGTTDRFGVAIACIDGRTHQPLTDWIREVAPVDWVDLVTEPGPDAALAGCASYGCDMIRDRLRVSLTAHRPEIVVIAGHADCAANPVDDEIHRHHLRAAVQEVAAWELDLPVYGVWLGPDGEVEVVALATPAAREDADHAVTERAPQAG